MNSFGICLNWLLATLIEFDPEDCPLDCSRPCEIVCPASAISLNEGNSKLEVSDGTNTPRVLEVCGLDSIHEVYNWTPYCSSWITFDICT